jgi:hypothetical protein
MARWPIYSMGVADEDFMLRKFAYQVGTKFSMMDN